jgi:hypothetical protein
MINVIRRTGIAVLGGIIGSVLLIAGIVEAGRSCQESITVDDRYSISISEIDCNSPEAVDRLTFLEQVHYNGRLAKRFNLLDPDLPSQLTQGFLRHPKVKDVTGVQIGSSRHVRVDLDYRE